MQKNYFATAFLLLFMPLLAMAQQYEYWLDKDYNHRTTHSIGLDGESFEVDVSQLQPGIHYLNLCAFEGSDRGAISRSVFYIADVQESESPVCTEYWMDSDYVHRVSSTSNTEFLSLSLDLSELQPGIHFFNVRSQGQSGTWGAVSRSMFYMFDQQMQDATVLTEYWFDNGYDNRQIDNSGTNALTISEDISSLQPGIHYLNVRAQGQSGHWGPVNRHMFYLYEEPRNEDVTSISYWIDNDKESTHTVELDNGQAAIVINTDLLTTGEHRLCMQGIGANGATGLLSAVEFKVGIEDILPWGTEEPWESKYIPNGSRDNYTEPATDVNGKGWTELGFDDSAWQTITGPIANNTEVIEPVNFNWPNEVGGLNLRRTFTMSSVPNGKYQLLMKHDDAVKVYLNKQLVVESYDCGTDFVYDIPSTALQVGENILAIYIDQYGGNNYLDYCLRYLDQQTEPYAVLSDNNTKLTFYYDNQKAERNGMSVEVFELPQDRGWESVAHNITTVEFDTSIANDTTITSTAYWFYGCQELTSIIGMENLKTQSVTDMKYMFYGCNELEHVDVSGFNTANVTDMSGMFYKCHRLQELDLSNFNTFKVKNMSWMFYGCYDITRIYAGSYWTTTSVTESEEMFVNCTNLVGGSGTTYNESHVDASYAHIDLGFSNPGYLSDKNAPVVTDPEPYAVLSDNNTKLTFYYDKKKDERNGMDVGSFSDINQRGWHEQRGNITKVVFDDSFADCYTLTSTASWFAECGNLATIENLNLLKTANVTNMHEMFYGCSSLTSIDLSSFNTANVTDMGGMFHGLSNVTTLDLSGFNTSSVTSMERMFFDSGLTSLDVSSFNTTNVTNMVAMFHGVQVENLNLSNFDTRNVTTMEWMFANCYVLRTLNISNFNTEKVQNMYGMFSVCCSLTNLDVSNFNTQNVTNMGQMFMNVGGETLDISNFNTENVTNMDGMFQYSGLVAIYVGEGWNTDKLEDNGGGMFNDCTRLVGGKGTIYDPNHTDVSYAHIDGGPSNPGYFTDKNAPEITATFDGVTLTVVGQTTMAQALEQVGGRDVVVNDIAAIVWNSTEAITRSDIEGFGNPNLLIYVQADSLAPEGVNNVVVNGKAKNIVLVDAEGNNNFYAPQEFTAESISYTREFKQTTQKDVSRGWEGICLPFTVQTYTHESHGAIAPFRNNASDYHFWLRQMTDKGLTTAENIEANMPYIISMPNSDAYPEAYNQAGKVTFTAENAKISKSTAVGIQLADRPIIVSGTYHSIATGYYALNVGHEYEGNPEGSIFVLNYREIRPFEVFTWHNGSGARSISISSLFGGEGTTDIIDVIAEPSGDRWYDMNGRRLQSKPVRKGVYIKNGKKIVVK